MIGELIVHPYQDVRVICEHTTPAIYWADADNKLGQVVFYLEVGAVTFDQDVELHAESSLLIEGAVETLSFMGGWVAHNSTATIRSSEETPFE